MEYNKSQIKENLEAITKKIRIAEQNAGRTVGSVKLLAVSKFHPAECVLDSIDCGQIMFGENRVQEASEKFQKILDLGKTFNLHIIGSLQRNKVKNAVKYATCIESVDRIELLQEIEKECSKINKKIDVLFEFHTGEDTKSGFKTEEDLEFAIKYVAENNTPHVNLKGFMTMAPFTSDKEIIKNSFAKMRLISEKMKKKYSSINFSELSMGMSGDFEIAIAEGSTEVRVGTSIFGERNY